MAQCILWAVMLDISNKECVILWRVIHYHTIVKLSFVKTQYSPLASTYQIILVFISWHFLLTLIIMYRACYQLRPFLHRCLDLTISYTSLQQVLCMDSDGLFTCISYITTARFIKLATHEAARWKPPNYHTLKVITTLALLFWQYLKFSIHHKYGTFAWVCVQGVCVQG